MLVDTLAFMNISITDLEDRKRWMEDHIFNDSQIHELIKKEKYKRDDIQNISNERIPNIRLAHTRWAGCMILSARPFSYDMMIDMF